MHARVYRRARIPAIKGNSGLKNLPLKKKKHLVPKTMSVAKLLKRLKNRRWRWWLFSLNIVIISLTEWPGLGTQRTRPYLCSGPCWLLNRTFFRWRRTYRRIRPGNNFLSVTFLRRFSSWRELELFKTLEIYRKRLYDIWNWAASRSLIDGNGSSLILFLLVSIFHAFS